MPIWVVSTSLELKDISVNIGNSAIIRGVSLALEEGEFVSLLGSNGAGKTTLFKAIAGVLKPCEGTLEFKGKQISRMSADKRVKQGLVLCPEGRHLFPRLSVRKNLMLGAYVRRRDHKGIERSLGQVHDMFPILEEREKRVSGCLTAPNRGPGACVVTSDRTVASSGGFPGGFAKKVRSACHAWRGDCGCRLRQVPQKVH